MLSSVKGVAKKLIVLQILYNCIIKFCIAYLQVPTIANYFTDVITVFLCIFMIYDCHLKFIFDKMKLIFVCFTLTTVVSFALNSYSIVLYAWGARNIFRFFVFFFACVHFLEMKDVKFVFHCIEKLFWANVILILIQKWALGYIGDASSGFFSLGKEGGGNGAVNIFLCIICAYQLSRYIVGKIRISKLVLYLLTSCIVAASIELKVFFVECVVLLILYVLARKITARGVFAVIFGVVILFLGTRYLEKMYPMWEGFFSVDSILENSVIYGDEEKVGRLSGMGYIIDTFLVDPVKKIFGIGLGNADFSSNFDVFASDFYKRYGYLSYNYFSSSWMLLETGICGTVCYLLWFVNTFVNAWKLRQEKNGWIYFSLFVSVIAMIQFFYNHMLRVETVGYLVQFCLAIVFIYFRKEKKQGEH